MQRSTNQKLLYSPPAAYLEDPINPQRFIREINYILGLSNNSVSEQSLLNISNTASCYDNLYIPLIVIHSYKTFFGRFCSVCLEYSLKYFFKLYFVTQMIINNVYFSPNIITMYVVPRKYFFMKILKKSFLVTYVSSK